MSPFVPAKLTGILSIMPTVTTGLIMVLHGRIGGLATAALLAHSVGGLIGMLLALTLVGVTIVAWGSALSLSLALATCVCWNLMLIAATHGRALFNRSPARRSD
jgi:ABC-type spermidine/putrescine transport system permease subunit I